MSKPVFDKQQQPRQPKPRTEIMRKFQALACLLAVCSYSPAALAETANYNGQITQVYTSQPYNFAFRVSLGSEMSGCSSNFAYMNKDNENYDATVALLLTAYSLNKPVTLTVSYVQIDGRQWCAILDAFM